MRTNGLRPLSCRVLMVAVLAGMLAPVAATAHAILVQSQPAPGASVASGKIAMSFRYNSRIDRDRSRITLVGPDHSQSVLQISPAGQPNVINTGAQLSTPGAYVLRWQVLAVDGHITRGDLSFTVTGP